MALISSVVPVISTSIELAANDGNTTLAVLFNVVPVISTLIVLAVSDGITTFAVLFNVVPEKSTLVGDKVTKVVLATIEGKVVLAVTVKEVPVALKFP